MRLCATVTPTAGALCPFGKAKFTSSTLDNASAFGKFAEFCFWPLADLRLARMSCRLLVAKRTSGMGLRDFGDDPYCRSANVIAVLRSAYLVSRCRDSGVAARTEK